MDMMANISRTCEAQRGTAADKQRLCPRMRDVHADEDEVAVVCDSQGLGKLLHKGQAKRQRLI